MRLPLLVACLVAGSLSGCSASTADGDGGVEAVPESRPSTRGVDSRVAARATVIDSGSGPELCLGVVQTSSPPACIGVPLVGWTWPRESEKQSGVRWGGYSVVGVYDGKRFHVEKTIGEAEASTYPAEEVNYDPRSRCATPEGGWRAPNPERATADDEDRVFTAAQQLPGYSTAWIDDQGHAAQDPLDIVVNVQVTGDIGEATRSLRRSWGGSLCVSRAMHTESEMWAICDTLNKRPDALGCSFSIGFLEYNTVYDGGTLQRYLDHEYGTGLVQVTSVLQRYRG